MKKQNTDLIDEAIASLKRGDTENALLVLERLRYPKFKSSHYAAAEYANYMALKAAA